MSLHYSNYLLQHISKHKCWELENKQIATAMKHTIYAKT